MFAHCIFMQGTQKFADVGLHEDIVDLKNIRSLASEGVKGNIFPSLEFGLFT